MSDPYLEYQFYAMLAIVVLLGWLIASNMNLAKIGIAIIERIPSQRSKSKIRELIAAVVLRDREIDAMGKYIAEANAVHDQIVRLRRKLKTASEHVRKHVNGERALVALQQGSEKTIERLQRELDEANGIIFKLRGQSE